MRKNMKPNAYLYPQPVLILASYDDRGMANAMNAAWGTMSDTTEITIFVSAAHKTMKNILAQKAFTVSMGDAKQVIACDYVGLVSGNQTMDKVKQAGFHVLASDFVNAPLLKELPLALECKLKSYDTEAERLVGEIVNISVDESILDDQGNIDLGRFNPIIFDPIHHTYRKVGEKVGQAFHDGLSLKK